MPDSRIAAIKSVVPTGRRIKGSETFIAPFHRRARSLAAIRSALLAAVGRALSLRTVGILRLSAASTGAAIGMGAAPRTASSAAARAMRSRPRRAGCSRSSELLPVQSRDADAQTIAKAVAAVDHDPIAGAESRVDGCHEAVGRSDCDLPHRNGAVFVDDIDVVARRAGIGRWRGEAGAAGIATVGGAASIAAAGRAELNCRGRNSYDILQSSYQKLCIDELVRKQRKIRIIELRAHLHRSRRGVDLIVERGHLAGCKLLDIGAIEYGDLKRGATRKLWNDVRQIVFRNREDDS